MRLWGDVGAGLLPGAKVLAALAGFVALLVAVIALPAAAHEVRPALIQITESAPGDYEVVWKQPVVGDMAIHLVPHLSSGAIDKQPTAETSAPGFLIRSWRVRGGAPLDGQTVTIEGLHLTVTDVLMRVTTADGKTISDVIRPAEPTRKLALSGPKGLGVPAYLKLGVEHILTGVDHLMFVLGLLLLVGPNWRLLKAITAFTVAHSITLGLAALGIVNVTPAIVEALVALSIVFVACELARPADKPPTLAHRHPWVVAFSFGLLHGLAFAGALREVGLPKGAEVEALFLFNVGVEIGQLMFIAVALAVMAGLRRLAARAPDGMVALARATPTYVIGGFAAFWLIERVLAV
ncbi:HupE/UreJ family protein [Phenylobacterium sp.]|uniref:HupE/UreJ family protein n=1 Tax=Phenylobacterium sp. TaxID=1871053 RepID=UPI0025E3A04F|nr:HupE/UreJ family protein [Phenylobacterium sp.]